MPKSGHDHAYRAHTRRSKAFNDPLLRHTSPEIARKFRQTLDRLGLFFIGRPEGKRPGPRFGRHPHVRIAHRRDSMQAKDGVTEQDFRNCDERKAGSAWV